MIFCILKSNIFVYNINFFKGLVAEVELNLLDLPLITQKFLHKLTRLDVAEDATDESLKLKK